MYGVPKFKENFFMKYKKEIMLSVGALVTIVSVVKFNPEPGVANVETDNKNLATISTNSTVTGSDENFQYQVTGYNLVYNGVVLGEIASETEIDYIKKTAYKNLVAELGYDPEVEFEIGKTDIHGSEIEENKEAIIENLQRELLASIGTIRERAYVMKIGDEFTVALRSEDEIKEVLRKAQLKFIQEEVFISVDLQRDEHNKMVLKPLVNMVDEATYNGILASEEELKRSQEVRIKVEDINFLQPANGVTDEILAYEKQLAEDRKAAEIAAIGNEAEEEETEGTMVGIELAEDVIIVEAYVPKEEIVSAVTATELITKENETEQIYKVQKGDVLSIIAQKHDMRLSELYSMNPGLKEKERTLQINDEVIVSVPEPELKVKAEVEEIYTETINKGTVYVDDPDSYKGSQKVIKSGSNGVMQVTALITKLNGDEVDRVITDKTVLENAVNKVVSKGTKPFPSVGATGNYIFPLNKYYISSKYGYRWGGEFHKGVDLAAAHGSTVFAADGGTVSYAGWLGTYGYLVEIDHGKGVTTRYAHNSSIKVKVGQQVAKGQTVALVGSTGRSTGPHVHFEIRFDGTTANPLKYLR